MTTPQGMLAPCPFCGSSDLAVTLSITCKGCGARCAKVYWNKRPQKAELDFISELIAENNELKSRQAAAPPALDQIIGHLGAALVQSSPPTDDQIILDHVRTAHELAKTIRRRA